MKICFFLTFVEKNLSFIKGKKSKKKKKKEK